MLWVQVVFMWFVYSMVVTQIVPLLGLFQSSTRPVQLGIPNKMYAGTCDAGASSLGRPTRRYGTTCQDALWRGDPSIAPEWAACYSCMCSRHSHEPLDPSLESSRTQLP